MSESSSSLRTTFSLGLSLAVAALVGCDKDQAPPPLPSAAPPTVPAPAELPTVLPEVVVVDAGTDAAVKTGGGGQSLAKCCSALASNAELAPEPNKTYMKTAAAACSGAVAGGQSQGAVLAAVNAALKGVISAPATCK